MDAEMLLILAIAVPAALLSYWVKQKLFGRYFLDASMNIPNMRGIAALGRIAVWVIGLAGVGALVAGVFIGFDAVGTFFGGLLIAALFWWGFRR